MQSIRVKLFLLIVLANGLLVAGLVALNTANFSRAFASYVAEQDARRVAFLADNVGAEVARVGSWQWVDWRNPRWRQIVEQSLSPRELRALPERPRSPSKGWLGRLQVRTNGQLVLGQDSGDARMRWVPITVDGQSIGELGFLPSARYDSRFDELFARQQKAQLVRAGLLTVGIAALLAIPFSGWLVAPIQRLVQAFRTMAGGDLSVRADARRRDELGQLAEGFNHLATVLEQNQRDRQQWVGDIAHELRTPIQVLLADIEAAQDGVREINTQWLTNLKDQLQRLSGLVADLNELSKSDAGALTYEFTRVDGQALIADALQHHSARFTDAGLQLSHVTSGKPVMLRADIARFQQLLSNLAQNSLRYTDAPGRVSVSLDLKPGMAELCWQDSSPGVSAEHRPFLFDRLYRVDGSRSRESGGSGLGLAIVANIVQAHGGEVFAEASELGGLQIRVRWPLAEEV